MSLKLISVNIERSKHLDLVLPFIEREQPDVLCVQELMERDIERVARHVGATAHTFVPLCYHPAEVELALEGIAIFSRLPVASFNAQYYKGTAESVGEMRINAEGNPVDAVADQHCALLTADCVMSGERYVIATTHFTWTLGGSASDAQRRDLALLFAALDQLGEFVLCGDFNAPRGGEIFGELAQRYRDNIPPAYTTSIDGQLHRAGPLPYMVDGLFSTPRYRCANVRLQDGLSDHMAIVAEVNAR